MVLPFAIFTGMPGPLEMFIVAFIILLLFGNRLPSVMRSMGKGIVEFKKGIKGIEEDVEDDGDVDEKGKIEGKQRKESSES